MKKQLLLILMTLLPMVAWADAVEINGIKYNLISKGGTNVADVTSIPNTDIVIIPEIVTYEGTDYSVKSIGNRASYNSSRLTSVSIPNSVATIGFWAFRGCSSLTTITIGNGITSIGERAFEGCSLLTAVNITDLDAWCKISFNDIFSNPLYYAHHLYLNNEELTNLVISNSVTSIDSLAFCRCSGLTSVTIPNSVKSIGKSAFEGCSSLTTITMGNSVTSIGEDAFSGCSGLAAVHTTDLRAWCNISFNNSFSNPLYYGHHLYLNSVELTDLVIPNNVTSIGNYTFYGCSGLTSVTIPNNVTSIGNATFKECNGLTAVYITNLEAWCKIIFKDNPLQYAHHLYLNGDEIKDLVIPNSLTSIGDNIFSGCSGLTTVTIPNSVKDIGSRAFHGCSGLTSVTIPTSVMSIGSSAFYNCSGLTSVTIPNSVKDIGSGAFYNCSGLTSVNIPNSVKSIGNYAFFKCSKLKTIITGWATIGEYAFGYCEELMDFFCVAPKAPNVPANIFSNSYIEYAALHIPASATESYTAQSPWKYFKEIVEINIIDDGMAYATVSFPFHSGTDGQKAVFGPSEEMNKYFTSSYVEHGEYLFYDGVGSVEQQTLFQSNQREIEPNEGNAIKFYFKTKSGMSFTPYKISFNTTRYGTTTCMMDLSWINAYGEVSLIKSSIIPNRSNEDPNITYVSEITSGIGSSEAPCCLCMNVYKLGSTKKVGIGDVIIEGIISGVPKETYKLSYLIDGDNFKTYELEEGTWITPEPIPTKEGYTFIGWSEIPETMPDHDVIVTGTFTINQYKITYLIDGKEYFTETVDYGTSITPPSVPELAGFDFSWEEYPATMPAHDITIRGSYTTGIDAVTVQDNVMIYLSVDGKRRTGLQKGLNIVRMNNGQVRKVMVK